MIAAVLEDELTARTKRITLTAESFEEEKLLSALTSHIDRKRGYIVVSNGIERIKWKVLK